MASDRKVMCASAAACAMLIVLWIANPAGAADTVPEPVSAGTGTGGNEPSLLEKRVESERVTKENRFLLTPHRPNYILPLTYNGSVNREPYGTEGGYLQPVEIKFQLSFKVDIAEDLFGNNGDLVVAYTQLSLWQAYNSDYSSPFRETNYEPEAFLAFDSNRPVLGLRNRFLFLGMVHQSNGRGDPLSRSWNRVYAQFILDRGPFVLSLKPWYRLREPAESDNNPDIGRYLGPGEVRMVYEWKKYVLALTGRCNFRPDNLYGAVQLEGSFPLTRKLKGYAQYFYGYGETLIDYNARTNRIGIGIMLTDWI